MTGPKTALLERFFTTLLQCRKTVGVALLVLIIFSCFGLTRLETDFNIESLFPRDDRNIQAFQHYNDTFGKDDNLYIITVEGRSLFSSAFVLELEALASDLRRLEPFDRVISFLDAPGVELIDGMELSIRPLRERFLPGGSLLQAELASFGQSLSLADPISANLLAPASGTAIVLLPLKTTFNHNQGRMQAFLSLRTALAARKGTAIEKIRITGMPAMRAEGMILIQRDQSRLLPLSLLMAVLVIGFLFRRIYEVFLLLAVTGFTLLFTFGLMGFLGIKFTILSAMTPIILVVTCSSYCTHPLARLRLLSGTARDFPETLVKAFADLSQSMLVCCVTTTLGFVALINVNLQLVTEFAFTTSCGVWVAFLVSTIILPLLVILKPPPEGSGQEEERRLPRSLLRLIDFIVRTVMAHPRVCVLGVCLAGTVGLTLGMGVPTRGFVFDDFNPASSLMQNIRFAEGVCRGVIPAAVVIETDEPRTILRGKYLRKAHQVAQLLRNQPWIGKVDSLTDPLAKLWTETFGQAGVLPEQDADLAQLLRVLETAGFAGFSQKFVADDMKALQVKFRMYDRESLAGSAALSRLREQLKALEEPGISLRLTGTAVMIFGAFQTIIDSLFLSYIAVLSVTLLIFIALYRHVAIVLIAFLGNLIPSFFTLGLMSLLDIPIKTSTITIFSIAIGLAVDDTIHFLHQFLGFLRAGNSRSQAVERGLKTGAPGMIINSLVLIAGFLILLFSEFEAQFLMGLLTSFNVFVAITLNLFFIPSCVLLFGPSTLASGKEDRE